MRLSGGVLAHAAAVAIGVSGLLAAHLIEAGEQTEGTGAAHASSLRGAVAGEAPGHLAAATAVDRPCGRAGGAEPAAASRAGVRAASVGAAALAGVQREDAELEAWLGRSGVDPAELLAINPIVFRSFARSYTQAGFESYLGSCVAAARAAPLERVRALLKEAELGDADLALLRAAASSGAQATLGEALAAAGAADLAGDQPAECFARELWTAGAAPRGWQALCDDELGEVLWDNTHLLLGRRLGSPEEIVALFEAIASRHPEHRLSRALDRAGGLLAQKLRDDCAGREDPALEERWYELAGVRRFDLFGLWLLRCGRGIDPTRAALVWIGNRLRTSG